MILPVAARELRVASRRKGTYWARVVSAGAAFLICFWMVLALTESRWRTPAMAGQQLFRTLFGFAFAYVLGAGMRATASSLSRERKEGTLGLLFLTDLKGYDIVFGKLAGNALDVFYSTVAILPVLAIPILMGGITANDFGASALVLMVTLFFSLTAGIFASSFCKDERESLNAAFLIVLVFALVLPVLVNAVNSFGRMQLPGYLTLASPGMLAFAAFTGTGTNFWGAALGVHGLSWVFVLLSSRFVARVWQDKPRAGWRLRWQEWLREYRLGNPQTRKALRDSLLERNPICWLGSRERQHQWYVWAFLLAMLGVIAFALWVERSFYSVTSLPIFYLTAAILKYWVASAAGHSFAAGRTNGTLELILSTPMQVNEILEGHWQSLLRQFRGPFAVLAGVEVVVMIMGAVQARNSNAVSFWILAHTAMVTLLVADSYALVWAGLWQAMLKKSSQAATSAAAARVLVLPWLGLAAMLVVCMPIIADGVGAIALWLLAGIFVDTMMTGTCKGRLEKELRTAAAEQWQISSKAWPTSARE